MFLLWINQLIVSFLLFGLYWKTLRHHFLEAASSNVRPADERQRNKFSTLRRWNDKRFCFFLASGKCFLKRLIHRCRLIFCRSATQLYQSTHLFSGCNCQLFSLINLPIIFSMNQLLVCCGKHCIIMSSNLWPTVKKLKIKEQILTSKKLKP